MSVLGFQVHTLAVSVMMYLLYAYAHDSSKKGKNLFQLREEIAQSPQEAEQLHGQLKSNRKQSPEKLENQRSAHDKLEALSNKLQKEKSNAPSVSSEIHIHLFENYYFFRNASNQVRLSAALAGFAQTQQYLPVQHAG